MDSNKFLEAVNNKTPEMFSKEIRDALGDHIEVVMASPLEYETTSQVMSFLFALDPNVHKEVSKVLDDYIAQHSPAPTSPIENVQLPPSSFDNVSSLFQALFGGGSNDTQIQELKAEQQEIKQLLLSILDKLS